MDPIVIATSLSAVAALAAAYSAWKGPIGAARMAEELRRTSEARLETKRFKLNVFATIMQERGDITSLDAVRALNSIDVAFSDSEPVRTAWAELFRVLNVRPMVEHQLDDRLRALLREMAADLGIADKMRPDDLSRAYFPEVIAKERVVQRLEREAALARLTSATSPASNSAQQAIDARWPPKPGDTA